MNRPDQGRRERIIIMSNCSTAVILRSTGIKGRGGLDFGASERLAMGVFGLHIPYCTYSILSIA